MKKRLTEAQAWVVKMLTDKGTRHRGIVAEWGALRGYRNVNRTIDTLIQRGLITCDDDDYLAALTPAGRAEAEPVGDAVQLAGDEEWWIALDTYKAMRQERDDLRAKLARAEAALRPFVEHYRKFKAWQDKHYQQFGVWGAKRETVPLGAEYMTELRDAFEAADRALTEAAPLA